MPAQDHLIPPRQAQPALPNRLRTWAGALCLPALPLALLASSIVHSEASHANADQLRAAVGHVGAVRLSAFFELAAAALIVAATMTLTGAVRQRGAALANAGAVLGVLGGIGMAGIGFHSLFIAAMVGAGTHDGLRILAELNTLAGPLPILFFVAPLALLFLVAGATRAGLVPRFALALSAVFVVADILPVSPLIEDVLGLIALSWIAWKLITQPLTQQDGPAAFAAEFTGSTPSGKLAST